MKLADKIRAKDLTAFLISVSVHIFIFFLLSLAKYSIDTKVKPIEIKLADAKIIKEIVEVTTKKSDGVKDPLIEAKEKVPVVKQEMPNLAKGEKPGERKDIKDKGPVGKETSNEGSPKGAEQGWTWGGDNFQVVKKITPQNRMTKDKSFTVRGEASKELTADFVHFHFYIFGSEIEVSKNTKGRGQLNAIRSANDAMENFKTRFKRAYLGRVKFDIAKEGDPDLQMASMYDSFYKIMTYSYVGRQKLVLTLDMRPGTILDDYMKEITNAGGSFSPITKALEKSNKVIFYNKEVDFTGSMDSNGNPVFNILEDYDKLNAEASGKAMGAALKGGSGTDDANAPQTGDSFLTMSVKDETKKKAEAELKKLAIDEAKKKAIQQSKDLGIPFEGVNPMVESHVEYKVKRSVTGSLMLRVFVTLYY